MHIKQKKGQRYHGLPFPVVRSKNSAYHICLTSSSGGENR